MALDQDQWYFKLKGLVPAWVTRETHAQAVFKAIAKSLAEQQTVAENHFNETFIDTGSDDYVAMHGTERSVERLRLEGLSSYRERVKRTTNKSNVPAIKELVDALLIRGKCTLIEHHDAANFFGRGAYLNRNIIDFQVLYNAFTILIDYQIPEPRAFYDRGVFLNGEFITGSAISSDTVFANVIDAVNKNKAYGTVYRLIERANP